MFLLPIHLVSGGGILNLDGIALYSYITRGNMEISYDDYLPVEFCGALGSMFFNVSQCVAYRLVPSEGLEERIGQAS